MVEFKCYWAMYKICKRGQYDVLIFKRYLLCVKACHIYSSIMSPFLCQKIGSKIDCVVYTGMYNFMKKKNNTLDVSSSKTHQTFQCLASS